MSKNANMPTILKVLAIATATVQLLDIIIHAATNQLEIIRVASNAVMLLWLAIIISGGFKKGFSTTAVGSISLYLLLNIVFLSREGLTNAEQGGELRVTLFLLLFLTLTLSTLLTYLRNKHPF